MPIPQLSTSNTFGQWLTTTQALVENYNYTEEVFGVANDALDVAQNAYDFANSVIIISQSSYDVANTVLEISQNAYDNANDAYDVANDAYALANLAVETSNTFFESIFSIENETSDANTYYPTLVLNTVGVPEDVYISSTKLSFNPSTGNLYSELLTSKNVATGNITASGLITSSNVTTGNITASGLVQAQDFNSTSDITLKENIIPINNSFDIINKLTGIKFNWKNTKETSYGLSAQEVEQVLPEIVKIRNDGLKGVNYLNIIAILVESVKELKNEIENLKKL
jgi:hypothetical protein